MKEEIKNEISHVVKQFSNLKLPYQNDVQDLYTNEHVAIIRLCQWSMGRSYHGHLHIPWGAENSFTLLSIFSFRMPPNKLSLLNCTIGRAIGIVQFLLTKKGLMCADFSSHELPLFLSALLPISTPAVLRKQVLIFNIKKNTLCRFLKNLMSVHKTNSER